MAEPEPGTRANPPSNAPGKYVDFFLYTAAAVSYIWLSIYHKWLLNWTVGPLWLVGVVWGLPALWNLVRRRPVLPRRGPRRYLSENGEP